MLWLNQILICLIVSVDVAFEVPSWSELPVSLSHEVLHEQRSDSSLEEIFEHVLPAADIKSAASGYFLHNDLLFRKWVPVDDDGVKADVFQLVVPTKFRLLVLRVAHDEFGHFGVCKIYFNILKHFFWLCVKRDVCLH